MLHPTLLNLEQHIFQFCNRTCPETLKNIGFAVNHAFLEKETYCRFKSFKLLTDNQSVIKAVEPYNPVLYIHATKQQSKI